MATIRRRDVLIDMETKEKESGKQNGELVSLHRAKSAGLRADMTTNRLRGVQAVDAAGNAIGHIYPVCIDNIRTFKNIKVVI